LHLGEGNPQGLALPRQEGQEVKKEKEGKKEKKWKDEKTEKRPTPENTSLEKTFSLISP